MKLRCFTGLVATMVMASTAGAADIYNKEGNVLSIFGSFVGGHCFSKNDNQNGDHSFVRYGLLGKTYINDQIFGFGMWEHEFTLNNVEGVNISNGNKVILGYTGIKFGNFGSIDYGRNYGVLYDVVSWTDDMIPGFGGDISFTDNFLSNRGSNIITYRNKNLFGLVHGFDFALQYQGKNDANNRLTGGGRTVKTANGEGYGVSASYTFDNGIAAAAAYTNSKRTFAQRNLENTTVYENNSNNDVAEAYSLGLKYDAHNMYLAATYGETYNMTPFGNFEDVLNPESIYGFVNKANNVELVAQYQFEFGLRPSISYLHSKASDVENGYSSYLKKCVTIGTSYRFDKNISTTVDYRINLLNKSDFTNVAQISTDDTVSIGVMYTF